MMSAFGFLLWVVNVALLIYVGVRIKKLSAQLKSTGELKETLADLKYLVGQLDKLAVSAPSAVSSAPVSEGAVAEAGDEAKEVAPLPAIAPATFEAPTPPLEPEEKTSLAGPPPPELSSRVPPPVVSKPAPPPKPPMDAAALEKWIVPWLIRAGVVIVFFAAAFFLKIAYNWLGPVGRVMIGIGTGLVFMAVGEFMERRKAQPVARALTGGGIMILYLTLFAAVAYFHLISTVAAFGLMLLVTAVSVTLSIRYDSQVIMILSLIGGFLTPIMVSTGQDNQVALMSYLIVLDLSLIGVSYWRRWRGITLLCFAGTMILFSGWAAKFYEIDKFPLTFLFASLLYLIFAVSDLVHAFVQRQDTRKEDLALVTMSALVYFGGMYNMIKGADAEKFFGLFALALAVFYYAQVRTAMKYIPGDRNIQRFLTGFAVLFLTLAIPLQLDYESVTGLWAAEALALTVYGFYGKEDLFRWGGLIIWVVAVIHLFGVDPEIYQDHLREHETFRLILAVVVTYVAVLAASGGMIYFYRKFMDRVNLLPKVFIGLYLFEAILFLVFMLVLNHYCFESGFYPHRIYSNAERGEILNISLILGLYASGFIVVGILYRQNWMRFFGLTALALAVSKVIFYDMSGLPLAYRMVSFLVVGLLLIGLALFYNKYKEQLGLLAETKDPTLGAEYHKEERPPGDEGGTS